MARPDTRAWAALAVACLGIAGIYAVFLALTYMPAVRDSLPWEREALFPRVLATHVVFSVVLWFLACLGVFASRLQGEAPWRDRAGRAGVGFAVTGVVLVAIPALLPGVVATMNNYIPALDHPLFFAGLVLFGVGTVLALLTVAWRKDDLSFGVLVVGGTVLVALLCFAQAVTLTPAAEALGPNGLYERHELWFWAGGHVLQASNLGLVFLAWSVLAKQAWGASMPIPPTLWRVVMGSLLLVVLPAPLVALVVPFGQSTYLTAFTDAYFYLIAVQPVVLAGALLGHRIRGVGQGDAAAAWGLWLSMLMLMLGGLYGLYSGMGDTRTPGHYHVSIGAVNLALMVVLLRVVPGWIGAAGASPAWTKAVAALYAVGQIGHGTGFWIAGWQGVARKSGGYGDLPAGSTEALAMSIATKTSGLAVLGGALFVILMIRVLLRRKLDVGAPHPDKDRASLAAEPGISP